MKQMTSGQNLHLHNQNLVCKKFDIVLWAHDNKMYDKNHSFHNGIFTSSSNSNFNTQNVGFSFIDIELSPESPVVIHDYSLTENVRSEERRVGKEC